MQPGMDPRSVAAQAAMVKILNTPPETIVSMLDRLEIPWEKIKNVKGDESYDTLVIRWSDLIVGERRLQNDGPFIKQVVEEMRESVPQMFSGEQIPGANHPMMGE